MFFSVSAKYLNVSKSEGKFIVLSLLTRKLVSEIALLLYFWKSMIICLSPNATKVSTNTAIWIILKFLSGTEARMAKSKRLRLSLRNYEEFSLGISRFDFDRQNFCGCGTTS